jgi:hypothetical protein
VTKLNPNPTSSFHDMRVRYDPSIRRDYEARSGGQAAGQEIRVSMLGAAIGHVSRAKYLYNTGPHSFRQHLQRCTYLLKRIKTIV